MEGRHERKENVYRNYIIIFLFVCIHFLWFLNCSFTNQVNDVILLCGEWAAGNPLFYKGASAAAERLSHRVCGRRDLERSSLQTASLRLR